jgi:hypothetical protein
MEVEKERTARHQNIEMHFHTFTNAIRYGLWNVPYETHGLFVR